ncbi:MAG: phosphoenolpyruvate carboxykinase (ATP) [Ignavibacteriales bacterium]|nr:phosphoenolpyruvate carboxykinase (ATP) [Ignavibacteriales bacterium]
MSKYLEFDTPATKQAMELASDFRLKNQGFTDLDQSILESYLMKLCMKKQFSEMKVKLSKRGPLACKHRKPHTARAASDKFVVEEQSTKDKIWWGVYNRPFSSVKSLHQLMARAQSISVRVKNYLFRMCYAGADPDYRLTSKNNYRKSMAQFVCKKYVS